MTITFGGSARLVALALGAGLGLAGMATAQDKLTITLDTPPGHVRNVWIGKFVDALAERSEGALKAEVFDSGQLYSSRDAGKAVARGDVGMAIVATPALARIEPNLNVTDLPMFNGIPQARMDEIVVGPLGQALSGMTAEKMGVVVPGSWYALGELNTYSTETDINAYDDLKGLQVRIPGSAGLIARYKALGATPVNLPFSDVPLALQQGAVDAIVSSNVSILSAKLFESGLEHVFVNRVATGYYMPIVSQDYWDSLSEEQQQLFRETWDEFAAGQRAAAAEEQAAARAELEAAGMEFTAPTEAEEAEVRTVILDLQDELVNDLGISDEVLSLAKTALQ